MDEILHHIDDVNATPTDELLNVVTQTPSGAGLLSTFGSLGRMAASTIAEMTAYPSFTPLRARRLKYALELGRRMVCERAPILPRVSGPEDLANLVWADMAHLEQEQLRVIHLNTTNRVMSIRVLYQGTLACCVVRPAEVFRVAIRENAMSLALVHNHPSGDVVPSDADRRITREIVLSGQMLDLELVDHIIVGSGASRYFSMRSAGIGWS